MRLPTKSEVVQNLQSIQDRHGKARANHFTIQRHEEDTRKAEREVPNHLVGHPTIFRRLREVIKHHNPTPAIVVYPHNDHFAAHRRGELFEEATQIDSPNPTDITRELYAGRTLKGTGVYQVPKQEETQTETEEKQFLGISKLRTNGGKFLYPLTVSLIVAISRLLTVRGVVSILTGVITSKNQHEGLIIPSVIQIIFQSGNPLSGIQHAMKERLITGDGGVTNRTLRTKEGPTGRIEHARIVIEREETIGGVFAYQDKVHSFTHFITEHTGNQESNIQRIKANMIDAKEVKNESKRETHIVHEETEIKAEIVLKFQTLTRDKRRGKDSKEGATPKITPVRHKPSYLR
jgi:hypothetical protein